VCGYDYGEQCGVPGVSGGGERGDSCVRVRLGGAYVSVGILGRFIHVMLSRYMFLAQRLTIRPWEIEYIRREILTT
jgi:hypothetical protein